ncbi:MAG: POTRA domain-containing protein, partial [Saprospiraceae bacterium]
IFILLLIPIFSLAQGEAAKVVITGFDIEGNKKTREATITRELIFQIGDTLLLNNLQPALDANKILLLNTGLFTKVEMNIKDWNPETYDLIIKIDVQESLYIFPIPILELADRNFNVWWKEQNHSLKRINFGVRLYYENLTGRNDLLKTVLQFGYTQKYELEYTLPYINKAQTIGLVTNGLFTRNKEVAYTTEENKLSFFRADKFQFQRYRFGGGILYRKKLFQKHQAEITYYRQSIKDSVFIKNIDFLGGRKMQQYFILNYKFTKDRLNLRAYPTQGYKISGELVKEGLGFFKGRNALFIQPSYAHYFPFGKKKKYSIGFTTQARYQFIRQKPAYYNNQALGYEELFIRGYEYYVIDGMDYILGKTSFRYEIFSKGINWGKAMPIKSMKYMPLRIFLAMNYDFGYVNDPYYNIGNPFANDFLYGGGIGVDLVVFVDKVFQLEYSVNKQGEKGFYIHFSLSL